MKLIIKFLIISLFLFGLAKFGDAKITSDLEDIEKLLQKGKYEEARQLLEQQLKINYENEDTHRLLIESYIAENRIDEILNRYQQLVAKKPDSIHHFGYAYTLFFNKKIDESMEYYNKALELNAMMVLPHIGIGLIYYIRGEPQNAIPEYRQAIALEPERTSAYSNLALCYAAMQETDKALATWNEALDLKPDDISTRNSLAFYLFNIGMTEEAIEHYEIALEYAPDNPLIYNELALVYITIKQFNLAEEKLQISLSLDPDNIEAHYFLATVYKSIGNPEEAIKEYEIAITGDESYITPRFELGILQLQLGNYDKAKEQFERILEIAPDTPEVDVALKEIEKLRKKSEREILQRVSLRHIVLSTLAEAEEILERLEAGGAFETLAKNHSIDKNSAANGGNLGYVIKGDMITAFDDIAFALLPDEISTPVKTPMGYHIIQCLKDDLNTIEGKLNYATEKIAIGETTEGLKIYSQIVEIEPKLITSINIRCNKAIEDYNAKIHNDPNNPHLHYNLALLYDFLGYVPKAEAGYLHSLKLNPDNIQVHNSLALLYITIGKIEEAEKHLLISLEKEPDIIDIKYLLANLYNDQEKFDEAIIIFQEIIETEPDFIMAHFQLAKSYEGLEENDKAIAKYKEIIKMQPDFAMTYNDLAWLLGSLHKDIEEGLEYAKKSIELMPKQPYFLDTLAELYYLNGKYNEAVNSCQAALNLMPNDPYLQRQMQKFQLAQKEAGTLPTKEGCEANHTILPEEELKVGDYIFIFRPLNKDKFNLIISKSEAGSEILIKIVKKISSGYTESFGNGELIFSLCDIVESGNSYAFKVEVVSQ